MRKHNILFFSALLFLLACKSVPNGIIDRDEMVDLLTQVHIVDGSLSLQALPDSLYKYGTGKYQYLFKQYHTDSARFKRSMKYYTAHPDVLIAMYDEVNANLQIKYDSLSKITTAQAQKEQQERINAQKKTEKAIQDSLAKKSKK
jgi:hypothetical protein